MGKRNGLLLSETQNGAVVPRGTANLACGTVIPVARSSGKAFSASTGTNGIGKDNIHSITNVKFYVAEN